MTTALSLHHLGETVLRALLEALARREQLDAVGCKLHPGCSLPLVARDAGLGPSLRFRVDAPLQPTLIEGRRVMFDGAHCVDVLCEDGTHGLAIEAKLGTDRVSRSEFTTRFLGQVRLTHRQARFGGSMTAILNHRTLPGGPRLELDAGDPAVKLGRPWFVVVRADTWRKWGTRPPSLTDGHVAVFEEIARAYGDADAFDALVARQIGGGFHRAWGVFT